jgi:hypothetical protein
MLHAGLCAHLPLISGASLTATIAILLRAFALAKQKDVCFCYVARLSLIAKDLLLQLAMHFLSVPSLAARLQHMAPDMLERIKADRIDVVVLIFLSKSEQVLSLPWTSTCVHVG